MQTKRILISAFLMLATLGMAQVNSGTAPTNDYPQWGFHILPLGPSSDSTGLALTMYQAADSGYTNNVNVAIQPLTGSVLDFIAFSKMQLLQSGMNMVGESTPSANEWNCEYTATAGGKTMHFYVHTVASGKKIYVATGSTLAEKWPQNGAEIKRCCDSMQPDVIAPPSPPPPVKSTSAPTTMKR